MRKIFDHAYGFFAQKYCGNLKKNGFYPMVITDFDFLKCSLNAWLIQRHVVIFTYLLVKLFLKNNYDV